MVNKIALEVPQEVEIKKPFFITIINNGHSSCSVEIKLKPVAEGDLNENWYSLSQQTLTIAPNTQAPLEIIINQAPLLSKPLDQEFKEWLELIIVNSGSEQEKSEAFKLIVTPKKPAITGVSLLETTAETQFLNFKNQLAENQGNANQETTAKIKVLETALETLRSELKEQIHSLQQDTEKQELELSNFKNQFASLSQNYENQGDIYQETDDYPKAISHYELATNLGSTTALAKLKQAKIKTQEIKHLDLGNGVILELVKIPAGSFKMGGSHQRGSGPWLDHEIHLESFLMGKYPVTQKQWEQVMGNNPSYFKGNNLPVEQVSWHDVVEFCEKVSLLTKTKVTMPSEAQWEYAARAGTTESYFFGSDIDILGEYAWYHENSGGRTQPVGQKKPNPWGIYDILGNVWEWCADNWVDDYHKLPKNGIALQLNSTTTIKTLRGGAWHYNAYECSSADRFGCNATRSHNTFGMRVVVPLETL